MLSEFIFTNPPFRSCHAPTIALMDSGIIVAWFAGRSEGHKKTGIWISSNNFDQWTKPTEVVNGKQTSGRSFACWNPVLYKQDDGMSVLFYKIGKSPAEWTGMLMTSKDGKAWSNPKNLPPYVIGPTKNKPIQLNNGFLLYPSSDEKYGCWKIHFEIMSESGWKPIEVPNPSGFDCIQPTILRHSDLTLQALCRSENGFIMQTWSSDEGKTWSSLEMTQLPNPNSAIDAVSLRQDLHLLVYNNTKHGRSSLTVALTNDGKRWRNILVLENGEGEFSYPSIVGSLDKLVHIVYTWNRHNIRYVVLSGSEIMGVEIC